MKRISVIWTEQELEFIRDNYFKLSWYQLYKAVNKIKQDVTLQALRHQCIRMKLKKMIQIRWCKEDIQFLIDNYKTMGNIEIAEILTEKKRSWRMIEGKKVVRKFVPKNIEKKMILLGLERKKEDLKHIILHNREIGKGYCWTKENNAYTLGIKTLFPEGTIRVWGKTDRYKYIKINGRYTQYSRYQYKKYSGTIPDGYNVWFRDGNTLNCEPENLYLVSNKDQTLERKLRKYPEELHEVLRLNSKLSRELLKAKKNSNGTDQKIKGNDKSGFSL